jgi:hypothetical protein
MPRINKKKKKTTKNHLKLKNNNNNKKKKKKIGGGGVHPCVAPLCIFQCSSVFAMMYRSSSSNPTSCSALFPNAIECRFAFGLLLQTTINSSLVVS